MDGKGFHWARSAAVRVGQTLAATPVVARTGANAPPPAKSVVGFDLQR